MLRQAELSALLVATALLPAQICRAQLFSGESGYAQLLARYDRNGNGLLDDRERAALLSPAEDLQPLSLSAFPLICDVQSAGNADGASSSEEQQSSPPPQVARRGRWSRRQFAENQPLDNPQLDQTNLAEGASPSEELDDGYTPESPPQPVEPKRQRVRFRNAVEYRMQLNETRVQPRSQPFARAATFGPVIGRFKQQPRRYFSANVDVGCTSPRAAFYRLVRY